MKQYLDLARRVLSGGHMVNTRNGNRLTVHGAQLRFDLTEGFPAMTTKRLAWRQCATELCWFLNGRTDLDYLHHRECHIWDANADADGNLGKIYGYQWRNYNGQGLDQIQRSIDLLRKAPASTRNVVTAWNPLQMDEMKLPPCHWGFQLHSFDGKLIMQASQRSVDLALGEPFNIASYALLCHLFARVANLEPVELIMDLGNIHIYESHIDGMIEQCAREPLPLPKLQMFGIVDPDLRNLEPDQFLLDEYQYHKAIKYELIA